MVFPNFLTFLSNKKHLTGGAKWDEVGQNGNNGLKWDH